MSLVEEGQLDSLAEVYSLIVCIDQVERAYIRDSIGSADYAAVCARLLGQYNALLKDPKIEALAHDIDAFAARYKLNHESTGISRIKVGIPATAEVAAAPALADSANIGSGGSGADGAGASSQSKAKSAKAVFEVTSLFITVMDGLKLGLKAKDDLHPLFSNLLTSISSATEGRDFAGRGKLVQWLIHLNKMKIDDELSEEEVRECLFDVNAAYQSYSDTLE